MKISALSAIPLLFFWVHALEPKLRAGSPDHAIEETAGTRLLATRRFTAPTDSATGQRIDWCLTWGTQCGKGAADQFCKNKGFDESSAFAIATDHGGPTQEDEAYSCEGTRGLGPHFTGRTFSEVKCGQCPEGRSSYTAIVWHTGAGSCSFIGWKYPSDPNDCSIDIRMTESGGFVTGTCHWRLDKI